MAMTEDERIEKVQRLLTAHRKTKEVLEEEAVTWELHPGTDIARNWTVVTAAYSGLEQTIKYLLAEERGRGIAELIGLREGTDRPYQTHDLSELFARLAARTQEIVQEFYARYQSLHAYVTVETVGKFLDMVSDTDGRGYERWRYTLIEDRPIPSNSPETLVALWGVCTQIAEERLWKNSRVRTPDEVLASQFAMQLEKLVTEVSVERQNAGEPFVDTSGECRDWAWRAGHPLNAFADILWHVRRYGEHGQVAVSDLLSDALRRLAHVILNDPAAKGRTSLRIFVERAQGATRSGRSIRWDRGTNRFEAVPWSLQNRHLAALPQNAVAMSDPTGMRLRALWQAAKRSGYRVLENRAFKGPRKEGLWFCTIELRAEDSGGENVVLSIWQKEFSAAGRLYMVEQMPRGAIDESVREWIEFIALKPEPEATWEA